MYTILVADDDEDILGALGYVLKQKGYNVEQAKDGAETIVKSRQLKPDLILLDIMMPDFDGFFTCRELKNKEETKRIPIIILTARGEAEDIKTAFKAGANDYLVKPFGMDQLLYRIDEFLGSKSQVKSKPGS